MRAELRPSSLGEILDRTAQMYRSSFLLYFGIAAVASAVVLVVRLIVYLIISISTHGNAKQFAGISMLASMGMSFFYLAPMAISMAAIMHAVATNYLGHATTIRQAYAGVRRRWYRYLLIILASYFYAIAPFALCIGIAVAIAAAVTASFGRNLIIGLIVVAIVAASFLAMWMMLRWALALPASLMEDRKVHQSLKRSAALTKGARWRIFVMLLLVFAVVMVISYAVQIPMFFLIVRNKGALTLATQVLASLGIFVSSSVAVPVWSIALTLFYYDQRIRKEGYDVEWLMEQAATPAHETAADPFAPQAEQTPSESGSASW